jgi:hypothetical protein
VLAVSVLAAGYCAAAAIPWLVRAIGPRAGVADPVAADQAAMSAAEEPLGQVPVRVCAAQEERLLA